MSKQIDNKLQVNIRLEKELYDELQKAVENFNKENHIRTSLSGLVKGVLRKWLEDKKDAK